MYLKELQSKCDQLNNERWNVTYTGLNYDYIDSLHSELNKNYCKSMGTNTFNFSDCIKRLKEKKKEIDEAIREMDYSKIYIETKVVEGSSLRKRGG